MRNSVEDKVSQGFIKICIIFKVAPSSDVTSVLLNFQTKFCGFDLGNGGRHLHVDVSTATTTTTTTATFCSANNNINVNLFFFIFLPILRVHVSS